MALGRKFTNGNKLDKVGFSINSEVQDDDSDGEESSNLHTSEANDADEHDDEIHNEIRERSAKEHMNMDPDSSEDPFANSAAGGGDEFMAVKTVHRDYSTHSQEN